MATAIVDAGPLVAFLDKAEAHHRRVVEQLKVLETPLLVCEAVLAESWHILRGRPAAGDVLLSFLEEETLSVAFHIEDHLAEVRRLLRKYRDVPMSLADACIVRMAEIHHRAAVFTLDSDFAIYRRDGRKPIALISPSAS